jgi:D-alanyl-D-alanine carboxypeptidase
MSFCQSRYLFQSSGLQARLLCDNGVGVSRRSGSELAGICIFQSTATRMAQSRHEQAVCKNLPMSGESAGREGELEVRLVGIFWQRRPSIVWQVFQRLFLGDSAASPPTSVALAELASERGVLSKALWVFQKMIRGKIVSLASGALAVSVAFQAGATCPDCWATVSLKNSNGVKRIAALECWKEVSGSAVATGGSPNRNVPNDTHEQDGVHKPNEVQVPVPDTPAARQFAAWLYAFDSGDRAMLQEFLDQNFPARAPRIKAELNASKQTGGFDLLKAEESTVTRFSGIVKERDWDQFVSFVIEVEPDEPHRITRLDITGIARPSGIEIARMSESGVLVALRAKLDREAATGRFSGAVLVARGGNVLFSGAYGFADREKGIPNTATTRFRIGSMNKMFTAVAVLQLVQAGKVNLTDSLGKYLPDYPNKELASKVTIDALLTHTGGTGDLFGPEFDAHRLELRTLEDYVKLYGKRPLQFEPGTHWAYSNYGFLLLGVVVEKASGENYYQYVREHIYETAEMSSTGSLPEEKAVPERSVGYTMRLDDGEAWRSNVLTLPYRGTSAGGGYSTVGDLLAFADAIQSHKLLDAHYTKLLTTGRVDTPDGEKYAYGFIDRGFGGIRCFGHSGGAFGMNGDLEVCSESGYVIAVLANVDPPAAQRVSGFITNRLPLK